LRACTTIIQRGRKLRSNQSAVMNLISNVPFPRRAFMNIQIGTPESTRSARPRIVVMIGRSDPEP